MKLCEIKSDITISDDFKSEITKHIIRKQPKIIIETGTYLGTGTTDAAIKGLIGSGHDGLLISIESDLKYIDHARKLHARYEASGYVEFIHGISLPKDWIPTELDDDFPDYVFTDHQDSKKYFNEIPEGCKYDMLGYAMRKHDYKIDMFILDSAGHLGTAEFLYITDRVKTPCYIFLDDTLHRKHYKTMLIAEDDSRCSVVEISREKFGHAIIHFKPTI